MTSRVIEPCDCFCVFRPSGAATRRYGCNPTRGYARRTGSRCGSASANFRRIGRAFVTASIATARSDGRCWSQQLCDAVEAKNARLFWKDVTAGLLSAAFCQIATARSSDATASAISACPSESVGNVVVLFRQDRLEAGRRRGWHRPAFCLIATACWYIAIDSSSLPISEKMYPSAEMATTRSSPLERGLGGAGVGQFLCDRQRGGPVSTASSGRLRAARS